MQGNTDPRRKVAGREQDELQVYVDLTRAGLAGGKADLAVWPETARPRGTYPARGRALAPLRVPLLLGAATQAGAYWNSVYTFERGGVTGRQDKVRLVPFGEFFPGRAALDRAYPVVFRPLGLPALAGAVPGKALTPLPIEGVTAGALICYESTFPAFARPGAARTCWSPCPTTPGSGRRWAPSSTSRWAGCAPLKPGAGGCGRGTMG